MRAAGAISDRFVSLLVCEHTKISSLSSEGLVEGLLQAGVYEPLKVANEHAHPSRSTGSCPSHVPKFPYTARGHYVKVNWHLFIYRSRALLGASHLARGAYSLLGACSTLVPGTRC